MIARLLLVSVGFLGGISLYGEGSPSRTALHVRLATPVASYMKVGTPFEATVMGAFGEAAPDVNTLPSGSTISGVVSHAKSIGLGVKHERASLELAFTTCRLPDGETVKCDATLASVDNARENVLKGRIQGILAASHPHSWLGGVWYRPGTALSGRSVTGLTGAGGKLQSAIAPSPIGAAVAIVSRMALFRLPDAEIELPVGTDLILKVSSPEAGASSNSNPTQGEAGAALVEPELRDWLASVYADVTKPDDNPADDIINLAFLGTSEQLKAAFEAAGWRTADALSTKTYARSYAAVAAMRSYPTAPVSPLFYKGRLPDAVFQRSFNSMSKRHHIRLWEVESPAGKIWLGAATHDVAAAFDWGRMSLTHRIDPNIDVERRKVIYDLTETGCVIESATVQRRSEARDGGPGAAIVTDGVLVVASLRDCALKSRASPLKRPKRAFATVIARRFILESRHYFTRGNAYYWAYRGVRWAFTPKAPSSTNVKIVLNPASGSTVAAHGTRPMS